jgi:flagellar L-ring protein precursor FlgH
MLIVIVAAVVVGPSALGRRKAPPPSAIDFNSLVRQPPTMPASPGSLYAPGARMSDLARDLRAGQIHDLVNIIVNDQASAVSTGVTNTSRKSSASASVTSLGKVLPASSPWVNLANMSGNQQLQGQATTSRDSTLTTTLSAEVKFVFANGNLFIQGGKEVYVNGEHQTVTIQGIIRPDDLSPSNSITSDRIANMRVLVNGKGIVNDAVKQPFFLYRLLLGLLPF